MWLHKLCILQWVFSVYSDSEINSVQLGLVFLVGRVPEVVLQLSTLRLCSTMTWWFPGLFPWAIRIHDCTPCTLICFLISLRVWHGPEKQMEDNYLHENCISITCTYIYKHTITSKSKNFICDAQANLNYRHELILFAHELRPGMQWKIQYILY